MPNQPVAPVLTALAAIYFDVTGRGLATGAEFMPNQPVAPVLIALAAIGFDVIEKGF